VAASAEGRIFSGREGKARGLVDELGGLTDAIARARTLASLPPDARVTLVGESSGLLDALGEDDVPEGRGAGIEAPSVLGSGLARIAPELVPFVASLAPLTEHERALCALPFALTVR
jgi:protease-4